MKIETKNQAEVADIILVTGRCYAEADGFNPKFVLANILVGKGFQVKISEPRGRRQRKYFEGLVEISGDNDALRILSRLFWTPEVEALIACQKTCNPPKYSLERAVWDDDTKNRVLALYWENMARFYQSWGESITGPFKQDKFTAPRRCQLDTEELLGSLRPLTPNDIHSLLEEVVDRVLSQSQTE